MYITSKRISNYFISRKPKMHMQSENTVLTISNAIALTTNVIQELSGNEIANTLDGSELSSAALHGIIGSQINKNFSNYTSQKVNA